MGNHNMIRLLPGQIARVLHEPLHNRLMDFAAKHTPEIVSEPTVNLWMQRMFAGDPLLHILVDLAPDTLKINKHAVIDVQQVTQGQFIVVCHQCQHDKPSLDGMDLGHEYMEKLATEYNAQAIVFFMEKHSKAMERKYGYKCTRTIMVKSLVSVDREDGQEDSA
jgi:hypothetical protein